PSEPLTIAEHRRVDTRGESRSPSPGGSGGRESATKRTQVGTRVVGRGYRGPRPSSSLGARAPPDVRTASRQPADWPFRRFRGAALAGADRLRHVDPSLPVVRRIAPVPRDHIRGVADVRTHASRGAPDVLDGERREPRDVRRGLARAGDAEEVITILTEKHETGLGAEGIDPLPAVSTRRRDGDRRTPIV